MKPRLFFLKREIGRTIENQKTKVDFVIVDSDTSEDYPLNFVCVLPQMHGFVNSHSIFGKLFGEDSVPLAWRLLSRALRHERDLEIKVEVEKRLKMFNRKNIDRPRFCIKTKNGV
jgi:hypothetical protein